MKGRTYDEEDFGGTATVSIVKYFDVIVEVGVGGCYGGGVGGGGGLLRSDVAIRHGCGGA